MAGKVFTKEEMRDRWRTFSDRKGMKSGDPMIVRGGWNCRHHWQAVKPEWIDEPVEEVIRPPVSDDIGINDIKVGNKKLEKLLDIQDQDHYYRLIGQPDKVLDKLREGKGFNAKPTLVDKLDKKKRTLYRGVKSDKHSRAFKKGEHFAGRGAFGNGTYFARDISLAEGFAGEGVDIIQAQFGKNARVVSFEDLVNKMVGLNQQVVKQRNRLFGLVSDGKMTSEDATKWSSLMKIADDPGKAATILGYDAIDAGGEIIVLNRGALEVLK